MNYDLSPTVTRLTPFASEGGALAAADVHFGPIMVRAKLYQNDKGYFVSWPSRKSGTADKWFPQVSIVDPGLRVRAQEAMVAQYQTMSQGELVSI